GIADEARVEDGRDAGFTFFDAAGFARAEPAAGERVAELKGVAGARLEFHQIFALEELADEHAVLVVAFAARFARSLAAVATAAVSFLVANLAGVDVRHAGVVAAQAGNELLSFGRVGNAAGDCHGEGTVFFAENVGCDAADLV